MTAVLRMIIPFGILIVASFLTRQEDRKRLDFFYARLRTPVHADHALDDDEVAKPSTTRSLRCPKALSELQLGIPQMDTQ